MRELVNLKQQFSNIFKNFLTGKGREIFGGGEENEQVKWERSRPSSTEKTNFLSTQKTSFLSSA